jgi:hypothetical protein
VGGNDKKESVCQIYINIHFDKVKSECTGCSALFHFQGQKTFLPWPWVELSAMLAGLCCVSQVPSVKGACFGKQLNFCVCAILMTSVKPFNKGLCLIPFAASLITDFTSEAEKQTGGF